MGIINASIIINTTTIEEYVGLKCKPTLKYVLPLRHSFLVACMLVHLFVIQLGCTFYDGLFWCNKNGNMTKEDLTIWEQTIKKVKIRGHCSIVLAKYMNENRKIFELWVKYVSV